MQGEDRSSPRWYYCSLGDATVPHIVHSVLRKCQAELTDRIGLKHRWVVISALPPAVGNAHSEVLQESLVHPAKQDSESNPPECSGDQ